MNDLTFSLNVLETIYEEAKRDHLSFAERAGLYASARALCDDFLNHIAETCGGDGNAREKVHEYRWHLGAALGFDITNGHDKAAHLGWTLGALWSLRDILTDARTAPA